jgi:hypothetical protein
MTNCIFSWYYILSGGGIPESRRASELSELLGVKILPSQVLLWDFILFLYDLLVAICFLLSVPTIVWLWNLLHSCLLFLVQVLQGHSPFKSFMERYMYIYWFWGFFILLFNAHVFNFKKWHVPATYLVFFFFFFVAVVVIDLPFSFIFNLVTTIPC